MGWWAGGLPGGGVGWCGGTGGAGAGEHGQLLVCGKYHLCISFIIIVLFNFLELKTYTFCIIIVILHLISQLC